MIRRLKATTKPKSANANRDGEKVDLLVVGGGATGACIAVDVTSRGLKVALAETLDASTEVEEGESP